MKPLVRISIRRLLGNTDIPLPGYHSAGAAGMDLRAAVAEPVEIKAGDVALIPTGIAMALPEGFEAQIRPRSGLSTKSLVTVINAPGTIDADYRGEVMVALVNLGKGVFFVTRGLRIAQLIVAPVVQAEWHEVEDLPATSRGSGGFGHTGL